MASRQYPKVRYGGIPELDNHIKRGPFPNRTEQYKVGRVFTANLTEARLAAASKHGLSSTYPNADSLSTTTEYVPASGYEKPNSKNPGGSLRKKGDPFDSQNRTFVRMARDGSAEISFPANATARMMANTIKVVRAARKLAKG